MNTTNQPTIMKATKSIITISIEAVTQTPYTLSLEIKKIEGKHYFDENDGTSLVYLLPAFADLAQDLKIESNGKSEAWLSTWDSDSLAKLAGKTITIEYTEFYTIEDGEPVYDSCIANRISITLPDKQARAAIAKATTPNA